MALGSHKRPKVTSSEEHSSSSAVLGSGAKDIAALTLAKAEAQLARARQAQLADAARLLEADEQQPDTLQKTSVLWRYRREAEARRLKALKLWRVAQREEIPETNPIW